MYGKTFELGNFIIDQSWFYAFLATVVMSLIVTFLLNKTDFGRAIRATSQDRDAALLSGIDIYRVYNITFGLSSAMVGVSGAFILPYYYLYPNVGMVFDIKAFVIVVLGGMGSMPGALVGGFIVGLAESLGGIFLTAIGAQMLYFAIFILILIFRPIGLLGREVVGLMDRHGNKWFCIRDRKRGGFPSKMIKGLIFISVVWVLCC